MIFISTGEELFKSSNELMPDRSLASKDISSTEAAKKLAEAKNSRASKDETLNKLNIKAVEDSHLDDSSNTSCL